MNGATPLAANVHMYTFHGNIYMINISKTNIYMYLLKMKIRNKILVYKSHRNSSYWGFTFAQLGLYTVM